MRILIVEDDPKLRTFIAQQLTERGNSVAAAEDGRWGLAAAIAEDFDVLVIDRRLPDFDGLSLIQRLRAGNCTSPALILSAMATADDRAEGLDAGADDYLGKPFGMAELAARLQSLYRRRQPLRPEHDRLVAGDIELDLDCQTVVRAGHRIDLSHREFALLVELMRHPGDIVTRAMLMERVWHFGFETRSNLVDVHLGHLRARLNAGFELDAIETVAGAGYRMRVA